MSRRDEVENEIYGLDIVYSANFYTDSYADLTRTLADEVDALTAERDEWKRRCEAMVEAAHHGPRPPLGFPGEGIPRIKWRQQRTIYNRLRAIAEGRDNG